MKQYFWISGWLWENWGGVRGWGNEAASCPCSWSLVGATGKGRGLSATVSVERGRERERERNKWMRGGFLPASVCLPTSFPVQTSLLLPLGRNYSWGVFCMCVCVCVLSISHPAHCLHPLSSRQSAVILPRRTRQELRQEQADLEECWRRGKNQEAKRKEGRGAGGTAINKKGLLPSIFYAASYTIIFVM